MPAPDTAHRPNAFDRLPAGRLLTAALASLDAKAVRAARILQTDPRTVQRLKAGTRTMAAEQWRTLAAALDARALYAQQAGALAAAVRRRIGPDGSDGT